MCERAELPPLLHSHPAMASLAQQRCLAPAACWNGERRLYGLQAPKPCAKHSVWPQDACCPVSIIKYYCGFGVWVLRGALQVGDSGSKGQSDEHKVWKKMAHKHCLYGMEKFAQFFNNGLEVGNPDPCYSCCVLQMFGWLSNLTPAVQVRSSSRQPSLFYKTFKTLEGDLQT